MRHTLVARVQDEPGVLNRVASLFRRRAFNIESLTVGRSEAVDYSRMTVVVDTAQVPARLVEESLRRMGAAEVLTAVFADKLNGKQKPIAADFIGVTVPDRFVFGFGMDAGGVWRNLPAVYAMKDAE